MSLGLFPLLGFIGLVFLGRYVPARWLGPLSVFVSAVVFVAALVVGFGGDAAGKWMWLQTGGLSLELSLEVDARSRLMLPLISGIALLVQFFSLAYMRGELHLGRYLGYLHLFVLAMLGLVVSGDLLGLFVCWELVGLSSYLLIGFWQERPAAGKAALKAFLINRLGDIGLLVAIFVCMRYAGTLRFSELPAAMAAIPLGWLTVAGMGLVLAGMGKSAQWPLSTWLPDAMAGPTPASALIHAATMVAAGVFLLVRVSFLLDEVVLLALAWVGSLTVIWGAFLAIRTYDFKQVLAGSTISQLGYMMFALGLGLPEVAFFHLTTHAFFKAGLFLAAGAVIHAFADVPGLSSFQKSQFGGGPDAAQDMRLMGGLRRQLPWVFGSYTVFAFSLVGLPFFSGFLSKDLILLGAWQAFDVRYGFPVVLAFVGVALTAYYTGRQWWGVFFGRPLRAFALHGPGYLMRLPLLVLGGCSLGMFFSWPPWEVHSGWFAEMFPLGVSQEGGVVVAVLSLGLIALGLGAAWYAWRSSTRLYVPWGLDRMGWGRLCRADALVELDTALTQMSDQGEDWIGRRSRVAVQLTTDMEQGGEQLLGRFRGGYLAFSRLLVRIERRFLDRLGVGMGEAVLVVAYVQAWIDRTLLDGAVRLVVWGVRSGGQVLRSGATEGRVQRYLGLMLLILAILLWWMLAF